MTLRVAKTHLKVSPKHIPSLLLYHSHKALLQLPWDNGFLDKSRSSHSLLKSPPPFITETRVEVTIWQSFSLILVFDVYQDEK